MDPSLLKVKVINRSPFPLPAYKTPLAAGLDLQANLTQTLELASLERALVPTGIFLALPAGYEAQVRPRSGLAYKKGLSVINSPGTIDADYRGEVGVLLVNLSRDPMEIAPGERIAQLVVSRHAQVLWEPSKELDDTERGSGGFGSTGLH